MLCQQQCYEGFCRIMLIWKVDKTLFLLLNSHTSQTNQGPYLRHLREGGFRVWPQVGLNIVCEFFCKRARVSPSTEMSFGPKDLLATFKGPISSKNFVFSKNLWGFYEQLYSLEQHLSSNLSINIPCQEEASLINIVKLYTSLLDVYFYHHNPIICRFLGTSYEKIHNNPRKNNQSLKLTRNMILFSRRGNNNKYPWTKHHFHN